MKQPLSPMSQEGVLLLLRRGGGALALQHVFGYGNSGVFTIHCTKCNEKINVYWSKPVFRGI